MRGSKCFHSGLVVMMSAALVLPVKPAAAAYTKIAEGVVQFWGGVTLGVGGPEAVKWISDGCKAPASDGYFEAMINVASYRNKVLRIEGVKIDQTFGSPQPLIVSYLGDRCDLQSMVIQKGVPGASKTDPVDFKVTGDWLRVSSNSADAIGVRYKLSLKS